MFSESQILESFSNDGLNAENLVTPDVIGALEEEPSDMEDCHGQ